MDFVVLLRLAIVGKIVDCVVRNFIFSYYYYYY